MPNKITGSTQVVSGAAALPGGNKMVYVIAGRGTSQPSQEENVPFDVISTADASTKWGTNSRAIDIVKTLIDNGVSQIRGVRVRKTGVQGERLTVLGAVTTAGNATSVVTAVGMTGTPVSVVTAVALGDTAVQVAAKVRTALKASVNVAAFFEISGSGAEIIITAKVAAAVDATMNFTLVNTTSAGLTDVAASTNMAIQTAADAYDSAMDSLLAETYQQCILVTDTEDDTAHSALTAHLTLATADDKFRYAVIGLAPEKTNADFTAIATTLKTNKRMFVAGPNPIDLNGTIVRGWISAAALASKLATETADPALPLNGIQYNGFGGVERVLGSTEKSALVTGGVTPIVNTDGKPTIYRAVSCYTYDAAGAVDSTWSEATTVMIADYVLVSVMNRLTANFKRTKNVVRILNAIRTEVIDTLRTIEGLEIIENLDPKTVVVTRDPSDGYGALVSYDFDVVTPLYTITITQRMKI